MQLEEKLKKLIESNDPESIKLGINILKNRMKVEDYVEYYFYLKNQIDKINIVTDTNFIPELVEIKKSILTVTGLDISNSTIDINKVNSFIKKNITKVSVSSLEVALKETMHQVFSYVTSELKQEKFKKYNDELKHLWI